MTVPKARHRNKPEPSHNLQENSYARFLQLDKTTMRRNSRCKVREDSDRHRGLSKKKPAQAR